MTHRTSSRLGVAGALLLALTLPALAQQAPSGTNPPEQMPPSTETAPQQPNPTNIPEKIAPPLERSPPTTRSESGLPDAADAERPAQQGLELKDPVPNTGGTAPVRPQ